MNTGWKMSQVELIGEGYTKDELISSVKASTGRTVSEASVQRMVDAGVLFIDNDGLYYKTATGLDIASKFVTFQAALLAYPKKEYKLDDGRKVQGLSYSSAIFAMRDAHQPGAVPSRYQEQVQLLSICGFAIAPGRSPTNKPCQVVYRKPGYIDQVSHRSDA